jgi:Rad51
MDHDSSLSHIVEPCPFCGLLLSETLQKKPLVQKITKPAVFQSASSIPRLTLGIEKLDSILHFLTLQQKICVAGTHTQNLVERLCVRAQLPHQYGGINTKVLLIDGANSSDLYQCVDFARQYGLDVKKILNGIISSRTFTIYQLANLITQELENAIKHFDVKLVVITNPLHYANDPYLDHTEMERIVHEMILSLEKIKDCLVIVSLDTPTRFDDIFQKLFSTTIKIESSHNTLSVGINNEGRQCSITLQEDELEKIQ